MRHGAANSNSDVAGKAVRVGTVTTALVDGTAKAVTFESPMPTENYYVFLQGLSNLGVAIWPDSKTVNGFTLTLSLALIGTISYFAVEY